MAAKRKQEKETENLWNPRGQPAPSRRVMKKDESEEVGTVWRYKSGCHVQQKSRREAASLIGTSRCGMRHYDVLSGTR